jgi:hypothetical protein
MIAELRRSGSALSQVARFLARLAPAPRLFLYRSDGVREPAGGHGRRYWVVSRALCRFFKVPLLAEASAARRLDALELQARRLSPFTETGSHHHFGPDFAGLWLWDAAAAREAAAAVGVDLDALRVVPETALLPPAESGVRLVETVEGVEAQSWVAGALAASRWWPNEPDTRAWTLFQRGASVTPDPTPPRPVRFDWLERPWTRSRSTGALELGRLDLRLVAAVLGAMLLIGYGYLGAEDLRLARELSGVEARTAADRQATRPEVEARAKALGNLAAIRMLEGLDRYPGQLALLARVTEILPRNETHLAAWTWEHGQLELTVAAEHPLDALYFVRSLQKIEGFTNVAAERAGENSLHIRLAVEPR